MQKPSKNIQFARWGGLSSVTQKGYSPSMPGFHSPPARRGLYAFPWPYIETFLLGATVFKTHRMEWVKDDAGNRINDKHPDYSRLTKERAKKAYKAFGCRDPREFREEQALLAKGAKWDDLPDPTYYLARYVRPRKFDYAGELWHHLTVKRGFEIETKGGWVKTDMDVYRDCLAREVGNIRHYRKRTGWGISLDHLEVFIEKV